MRITLCGSLSFGNEILDIGKQLESQGHTIFYPESLINPALASSGLTVSQLREKHDAIRTHYKKIEQSDAILVINNKKNGIGNYIGGNTLMEIGFAYILDKSVFLLNPIPDMHYSSEIEATYPIILGGNLDNPVLHQKSHTKHAQAQPQE